MITIYDIANATGYSAPTVSKALNGTGHLSETTRNLILKQAREMGYEPNSAARSLTTKRTYLIGVIYDDHGMQRGFSHPLFSSMLNKFRENVEIAGYDIIFLSCHTKMSYIAHAAYRSVEGIAIINAETGLHSELEDLGRMGIPCVSTNALIPGICTILTDNKQAGYKAAEYLVSMGHTKIGFLAGPNDAYYYASKDRYLGFCQYLSEKGIPTDSSYYEECMYWQGQSGQDGFARLYKRHPDITAVFAASDLLAMGVIKYAHSHNIKIPEQLSIIGFDDDYTSEYTSPRLTTFRQDSESIANLAAELLLQHMVGLPISNELIHLPATFIARDSVYRHIRKQRRK